MKISVVTISYNQAEFLRECIDSVLSQNFNDLEYIVVDPGSTDSSREIIDSYGDQIVRVYDKDKGPADGLNKGFACATGDIFYFLNSDDELLPDTFHKVAKFLTDNPNVDVVSGCGYFTNTEGKRLRRIVPSKLTPWLYVHGGVSIFQQGTFFRASFYKRVGGFNIENKTCWDGELFLDMGLAGAKFATIGDDLAHFRLHEGGITGSGRLEQQYKKDTLRLFVKGTGRQRTAFDRLQAVLARMVKGIIDPAYYCRRISSLFINLNNG